MHRIRLSSRLAIAMTISLCAGLSAVQASDMVSDPAFGNSDGWQRLYEPAAGTQDEGAVAQVRLAGGDYMVATELPNGGANSGAGKRIGLFRLNSDGHPVTSWGNLGFVAKDAWLTAVTGMAVDAQGRIIVVGPTPGPGGLSDYGVVRFNADGSDDSSFAGDGGTAVGADGADSTNDYPNAVLVDADGSILVTGTTDVLGSDRAMVVSFNTSGTVIDGWVGTFATGEPALGQKLLRIADGYYVVAGTSEVSPAQTRFGACLLPPGLGDADTCEGSLVLPISGSVAGAALVNPDTVLLFGTGATADHIVATRIRASGDGQGHYDTLAVDPAFIGNGQPGYPNAYHNPLPVPTVARDAVIDAQGRSLLAGFGQRDEGPLGSGLVLRLRPDGSADTGFGD
ncbi:MAG TPA: hypothetical protein VFN29_00670 [Chiayiivirga sp.]|nr:hypothetical protein [Chiayiivirga sp.]